MNRELLLDEAIAKAKEAEDWQLVEWLRMARGGENAARWYTAKLGEARLDMSKLMTENAKLRELVEDLLSCIEIRAAFGRPPTDEMYETFAQRARELGVEVDG